MSLPRHMFDLGPGYLSHYMSKPIPKFYYEQIKMPGSVETAVDNFWCNTLPHYFTQEKLYGMELEQRPLEGIVKERADFTIRCIKNGSSTKVVLIEDKKIGYETQSSKWIKAVDHLTRYLNLVRTEHNYNGQGCKEILYGAITIETYVRFYYYLPDENKLRDYPSTSTGKAYELQDDEDEIHKILNEYVAKTAH